MHVFAGACRPLAHKHGGHSKKLSRKDQEQGLGTSASRGAGLTHALHGVVRFHARGWVLPVGEEVVMLRPLGSAFCEVSVVKGQAEKRLCFARLD